MNWGIIITIIGVVQIAMGTFLTIYGPSLVHKDDVQVQSQVNQRKLLTPPQVKLLWQLYEIQSKTGASKLVISSTDGAIFWDNEKLREQYKINVIGDFYSVDKEFNSKSGEFENLIHSIPLEYLKHIPEMRLDSPYVVSVTDEGIKYLREKQ